MTPNNQPLTLEERMTRVETTLEHLATKEEIAIIRTEIADLKVFIMRWVAATMIASIAATAAVAITISRLIG